MAKTTFSGPVHSDNGFVGDMLPTSLVLPVSTAATLGAATAAINTAGKTAGKVVVDVATGLFYVAVGAAATDNWLASDGTTTITPA